ncbi:MAG TPA: DUF5668 domain-containing protein [Thermoanaerobaculia bacterium]|nr:DUF5668 domain-containing protein [Thermoanaerobaculia bacterium]
MQTSTIDNHDRKVPAGKLAWGVVLLVVGALIFFDTIDLFESRPFWSYWPLFLIVLGAAGEFDALRARKSDGSFVMLGIGVWMLAGSLELFGLSYRSGFPLAVIVAGLGVIVHAIVDAPPQVKSEEKDR